MREDIEIMLR